MKYYRVGDFFVTSSPKAGSKSIEAALGSQNEVQASEAYGNRVVTFFRHPVQRLQSAWKYFNHTVGWPRDTKFYQHQHRQNVSYDQFVDNVLDGMYNRHWSSQSALLMHGGHFVPTELWPFESIEELWPLVVGGELKRLNASKDVDFDEEYGIHELLEFYQTDMDYWMKAQETLYEQTAKAINPQARGRNALQNTSFTIDK